jgi:hypothetical protein
MRGRTSSMRIFHLQPTPTYHNVNRINAIRISAASWFAAFKCLPREVIYHCSTTHSISLATKRHSTVIKTYIFALSPDNSIGLWARWSGFDSQQGQEISLYSTASRTALGPIRPPTQWTPGVKRPGYEADHSPPSNIEVKNGGTIPPLPHMS